ncbi:hypothetical protein D3C73_1150290 [compost metagenome]
MGLQADPVDLAVCVPEQGGQRCQRGQQAQRKDRPARAGLIHAAAAQADQQGQRVQAGAQADSQRQAGMGHDGYQHQVHQLRQNQHADGDLDRSADVLLGVEAGGQNLHGQQADQAGRVGDHGQAGLQHILCGERAVVEQGGNQAVRQQRHAHGGGQAQQQHQTQAPVQQGAVAALIVAGVGGRQARQKHRAQCHAQQGGGKLHQPVGERQPGHAARCQPRGDIGVDQQRNLRHRHA